MQAQMLFQLFIFYFLLECHGGLFQTLVLAGGIWTFEIATYPPESSPSRGNPTPRHMPTSKPRAPLYLAKDCPHIGRSNNLSFLKHLEGVDHNPLFFVFLIAAGKYWRVGALGEKLL